MRTNPLKASKINQLTVKAYFLCFCWFTKNLFQFSCNLSQDGKGFLYSWFAFLKQICWMQPCRSYILCLLIIYQYICIAYCCQNYPRLVWIILSIIRLVCRLIQSIYQKEVYNVLRSRRVWTSLNYHTARLCAFYEMPKFCKLESSIKF